MTNHPLVRLTIVAAVFGAMIGVCFHVLRRSGEPVKSELQEAPDNRRFINAPVTRSILRIEEVRDPEIPDTVTYELKEDSKAFMETAVVQLTGRRVETEGVSVWNELVDGYVVRDDIDGLWSAIESIDDLTDRTSALIHVVDRVGRQIPEFLAGSRDGASVIQPYEPGKQYTHEADEQNRRNVNQEELSKVYSKRKDCAARLAETRQSTAELTEQSAATHSDFRSAILDWT